MTKQGVRVTVNGRAREGFAEPRKTLADFLREDLQLTGTHLGCEHGVCGACTILLDGDAVRSCLLFAVQADGSEILTIEGSRRTASFIRCRKRCATATASNAGSAHRDS
jgi:carbon-monoxide dehydrogenase small subunit